MKLTWLLGKVLGVVSLSMNQTKLMALPIDPPRSLCMTVRWCPGGNMQKIVQFYDNIVAAWEAAWDWIVEALRPVVYPLLILGVLVWLVILVTT
jgi:hypothetical protein